MRLTYKDIFLNDKKKLVYPIKKSLEIYLTFKKKPLRPNV